MEAAKFKSASGLEYEVQSNETSTVLQLASKQVAMLAEDKAAVAAAILTRPGEVTRGFGLTNYRVGPVRAAVPEDDSGAEFLRREAIVNLHAVAEYERRQAAKAEREAAEELREEALRYRAAYLAEESDLDLFGDELEHWVRVAVAARRNNAAANVK